METTMLCVCVERENVPPPVLFFLTVVAILSSVKKPPRSRWNQSASLSFRSSVGKSLREDKEQEREEGGGNGQLGKMTQHFSTWMFFICSPLPSSLPSLSSNILSPPPPLFKAERKKPLPSFRSFNSHLLTS